MATLRIQGIQMAVGAKKDQNLPRILNLIERSDSDIVVFPEMALTGYNPDFSESRTSDAWRQIAAVCRKSYKAAIFGTGAHVDGHVHIQARAYGDEGELIGTQDKLVPTESDRVWCRPGAELNNLTYKGLNFGVLNGNDLWVTPGTGPYPDPRLSYQLAQRGASVLFHLNSSGGDVSLTQWFDSNLYLRAREAKCPIITVNAAIADVALNAPSGVIGPDGRWITRCPPIGESTFHYEVDID